MRKLTIALAVINRSNKTAKLIGIDVESKTCLIDSGKEKTIKWSSATDYKLDTGTEDTRTLTPKLLVALYNAEDVHEPDRPEEAPAFESLQLSESEELGLGRERGEHPGEDGMQASDVPEDTVESESEAGEQNTEQRQRRTRTPRGTISDNEIKFLALIPALPDYSGTGSEMLSRPLIKKMQEVHGVGIDNGRGIFISLKNKGYYTTQGREAGKTLTTFQLSELGIKHLTENGLIELKAM